VGASRGVSTTTSSVGTSSSSSSSSSLGAGSGSLGAGSGSGPSRVAVSTGIKVKRASDNGAKSIKNTHSYMLPYILDAIQNKSGTLVDKSKISDILYAESYDLFLVEIVLNDGTKIPLEGTMDRNQVKLINIGSVPNPRGNRISYRNLPTNPHFRNYAKEAMESLRPIVLSSSFSMVDADRLRLAILNVVATYARTGMVGGKSKSKSRKQKPRTSRKSKKQTKRKHKKQH
jgi:hypothetical protein